MELSSGAKYSFFWLVEEAGHVVPFFGLRVGIDVVVVLVCMLSSRVVVGQEIHHDFR